MAIYQNPNKEELQEIIDAVAANEGYCPCEIEKNQDTKCPCKSFRTSEETDFCHCGRFYKIKEYEAVTQETLDKLKTHTLKLEIGALLDSGKVIKLENLKDYTIDENNNKFYIYQKSANTELNPEDIDEYRNLTD